MEDNIKRKHLLIPFFLTDRGSIEAWINRLSSKGWQFVETRFFFFATFVFSPICGKEHMVHRLKSSRYKDISSKYRKADGWSKHSAKIAGYEIWSKMASDPHESCPTHAEEDLKERRWYTSELLANLAWGCAYLLEATQFTNHGGLLWMPPGRERARCIVSAVLGAEIIVYAIIRRRNIAKEPGLLLQFLSSILSLPIAIGIVLDIILTIFLHI